MSWAEIKKAINSDIKKSLDTSIKELFSSKVTPIDTKVTTTQTKVNSVESKVNNIETKTTSLTQLTSRGNIKNISHYSGSLSSDSYETFSVQDVNKSIIICNIGAGDAKYKVFKQSEKSFTLRCTSLRIDYFVTIIEFY